MRQLEERALRQIGCLRPALLILRVSVLGGKVRVNSENRIVPFASIASRSSLAALLAASALGGYAPSALAQAQQQARHIDVSVSNRLQYDTDVVLGDPRLSEGGKGDVSTAPSLNLDIYLPRATGSFYIRGTAGYNFYRKYTRLNRQNIDIEAGADQRAFGDCIAHVSGNYTSQLSNLGDILSSVPITESLYRNTEETKMVSGDVGCGGAIGLRPSAAVSHSEVRNSSDLRKYSDADTNSITGQLGYSSPAIGIVSVFGRYSDSKYVNRVVPGGGDDGLKTYAAGVQLERNVGTRLSFTGSVNYTKVDPYLGSVNKFSGIGFDLSATYRGDLFQLALTGGRVAEPSTLLYASYDVATNVGATLTAALTERLRWSGGATYRRREFQLSPIYTNAFAEGSDDVYTLNTGLAYQMSKRLSFSLDGSYTKRNTDVQLYSYDQKRISLTTTFKL